MASSPGFAATPNLGSALAPATADTSLTAPTNNATNVSTVLTAAASGTRIDEIRFQAVGTTVAGVVNVFAWDGTTHHLIDQVLVSAVTSSTTAVAWQQVKSYQNLVLKSNSWQLRFAVTVAGLQSMIKVTAFGADF